MIRKLRFKSFKELDVKSRMFKTSRAGDTARPNWKLRASHSHNIEVPSPKVRHIDTPAQLGLERLNRDWVGVTMEGRPQEARHNQAANRQGTDGKAQEVRHNQVSNRQGMKLLKKTSQIKMACFRECIPSSTREGKGIAVARFVAARTDSTYCKALDCC